MKQTVLVGMMVGAWLIGGLDGAGTPALSAQAGQAAVTPAPDVPTEQAALGSVRIPRSVMANGQALPAGTYQVRVTAQQAAPPAKGQTPTYERWVEFLQGGEVKGREVVSVIPEAEIGTVAESSPPSAGSSKVELLKGDDYLRIWINRNQVHYLIHLPVA